MLAYVCGKNDTNRDRNGEAILESSKITTAEFVYSPEVRSRCGHEYVGSLSRAQPIVSQSSRHRHHIYLVVNDVSSTEPL
jgi:hypothetical protein